MCELMCVCMYPPQVFKYYIKYINPHITKKSIKSKMSLLAICFALNIQLFLRLFMHGIWLSDQFMGLKITS